MSPQVLQNAADTGKAGLARVYGTYKLAKKNGFGYVWIDRYCIDKSSSVELSEAINSMYARYRSAKVCYAYLKDVTCNNDQEDTFATSQWFTCGWILQKPIAPRKLIFCVSNWESIRIGVAISESITAITRIETEFLHGDELKLRYACHGRPNGKPQKSKFYPPVYSVCSM